MSPERVVDAPRKNVFSEGSYKKLVIPSGQEARKLEAFMNEGGITMGDYLSIFGFTIVPGQQGPINEYLVQVGEGADLKLLKDETGVKFRLENI